MMLWEEGSLQGALALNSRSVARCGLLGWDRCLDGLLVSAELGRSRANGSALFHGRVEQLYQKVMALWHQLHMNTKSLISWNYLRKDIALVQSFSMEKVQ